MNSSRIRLLCLGVALMWAFTSPAQPAHAQTPPPPWQQLSQSELTAVWWQWVLGVPLPINPLFDETGANAYSGQPYTDLLFLCGTLTIRELHHGDQLAKISRSISVKQGTALFFPLLNTEGDNVCYTPSLGGNCFNLPPSLFPQVRGVSELRALAAEQMDPVDPATDLYATLKQPGKGTVVMSPVRLQSPTFSYTLPADNIYQAFGITFSGTVPTAVAHGYYVFMPGTLEPGSYTLQFGGTVDIIDPNTHTATGDTFTLQITYKITVTQ